MKLLYKSQVIYHVLGGKWSKLSSQHQTLSYACIYQEYSKKKA